MSKLQWCTTSASRLSELLTQAKLDKSAAIGNSTMYQIIHEGREMLAIALPDGQVIVIDIVDQLNAKRRRADPERE
jgi:predicted DNA-binding protein (UPF0251 family)